jgi:hypothetical protein
MALDCLRDWSDRSTMLAILLIAACLAGGLIEHHRRFDRPRW